MRAIMLSLLLPALFLPRSCNVDLGNPLSVGWQVENVMRPYFASVHTIVSPQKQMLIAVTCIEGDGPQLVSTIADVVRNNPDIRKLKTLRTWGPVLGSNTYANFELAFRDSAIVYNVDSGEVGVVNTPANWDDLYTKVCALPDPVTVGQ